MDYKYKNVSAGYIGNLETNATLNSQYYAKLFTTIKQIPKTINQHIIFPQRIPRQGFFIELHELESDDFKNNFKLHLDHITKNYKVSLENLSSSSSKVNIRQYINWLNILLRSGLSERITKVLPHCISVNRLEIELLHETAKIENVLSTDKSIDIDKLLHLFDKFNKKENTSNPEKIKLLNVIIVYYYRHLNDSAISDKILNLSQILNKLINNLKETTFFNKYLCSVAYRGLAMVSELSFDIRTMFLNNALFLANNLKSNSEIENIVGLDNLYTCTQSFAKWHLINNDLQKAESCLHDLIVIDPFDSTGYSELGFFYIKNNSYHEAAKSFKKAMELGPPGTGMNAYYYAQCQKKIGNKDEAIKYLHHSTILDSQAISPWLDLLDLYSENITKSYEIAFHIHNTEHLMEQLEEDEIQIIQSIIN